MASLLLMNFLDVARSLGPNPMRATPEEVAAFMAREFHARGGTFNYDTSIKSLPGLFAGSLTVDEAIEYCSSRGSPAGRLQNATAIRIAGAYAFGERSQCYKIPFSAVPVGRLPGGHTAYMAIKAPLVRVQGARVFVVVPGFRLGHRPRGLEIDVAASLAVAVFAREGFHEADYEYLDCSRGSTGARELSVYRGCDRSLFDLDQVDELLETYVKGLSLAIQAGMPARNPNFRGYKVIDPDQPFMF